MNRQLALLSVLGGVALYGYVHASDISKMHKMSSAPEAQAQTSGKVVPDALSTTDQKPSDTHDAAHQAVTQTADDATHRDTAISDAQKPSDMHDAAHQAVTQTADDATHRDTAISDTQKPSDIHDAPHQAVTQTADDAVHADTATSDAQKPELPQATVDHLVPKVPAVAQ